MELNKKTLGAVAWECMFGDNFDDIPDINKPENSARVNAENKRKIEELITFWRGAGSPFLKNLQLKSRSLMFDLITKDREKCSCQSSKALDQISLYFKLLAEAENIIKENNNE